MRILLIEDDIMIGKAVQHGLSQAGFAVDWVTDGRAAELSLANGVYDLMLDAGQLFYYESTYAMMIEDKVDPPFSFSMGGTAGAFVPAPPPVPVPEVSLLSIPVMGALAGGLIWRRRKKA